MKIKHVIAATMLLCGLVYGQGGLISDVARKADGSPAPGATIRVCAENATGTPCAPIVTPIYSERTLTLTKSSNGTFPADVLGNYSYALAPGFYKEQVTVGASTYTRIVQVPTSSSSGGGGGGGTGDLQSAPSATQTVVQPQATTLNVNSFNKIIYNTVDYNWLQTGADDLAVAGSKTITLTPCPKGVSGTNPDQYVLISGTGTAEFVKITGGTCSSGSSTGTITAVTGNNHPTGWTVGSATQGAKESSEYGKFTPTNPSGTAQSGVVIVPPGELHLFGPLYIEASDQVWDFSGTIVECFMASPSPCIHTGADASSTSYTNIKIKNLRLRAMVAGAGGFVTNAETTIVDGFSTRNSASGAYFYPYVYRNDNDQANVLRNASSGLGGNWGHCTTTECTAFIGSTGGSNAGITQLSDSDLTLNCLGNGIDWGNANTLNLSKVVIQGYSQFGLRVSSTFGVNPAATWFGGYEEVGNCTNPLGIGVAGIIVKNGRLITQGLVGPVGKIESATASSSGSTRYSYYVVAKSSTLGTSSPFFTATCLTSGTGTCTVKWYQIGSSGTMTWDILRQADTAGNGSPAPYPGNCGGGTVNACGSVATAITTSSCANNVCTLVDDITANSTNYSVLSPPTFFPKIDQWGASITLSPSSDTNNVHNGAAAAEWITDFSSGGDSVSQGPQISVAGIITPAIKATSCIGTAPGIITQCGSLDSTLTSLDLATYKNLGRFNGGITNGLKGREILSPGNAALGATELSTIIDSNPSKTVATLGHRPTWDLADTALCTDSASAVAASSAPFCFMTPVSISQYINTLPDGTSWKTRLTSTGWQMKVPIDFQSGVAYEFSGPELTSPTNPASGFQKCFIKAAVGMVCRDSSGTEYAPGTGAVTSVFGRTGAVVATSGDYTEAQISFTDITTNNVSSTKHGFVKKLTGNAADCYLGDGTFATCPGTAGSGITTLNTLTAGTQTFAKADDTNVTLTIGSVTATHTFTMGWTGTLAKARITALGVFTDQANTFGAFLQDLSASTMKIPTSAGAAPTANGDFRYDSTSNTYEGGVAGVNKTFAMTDGSISGNAGTASALAANPSNCSGIQFPKGIDATGAAEGCANLADADIPDTITASNYVLKAGDTLTGQLVASNLGIEFNESDTNPTCATGNFNIYSDTSENKLKKCQNGVSSDLDTSGVAIPGGANTTFQFNDSGVLNGDAGAVYDKATGTATFTKIQTTGSSADDYTVIAVPTSPSAGHLAAWADSTDLRFHDKNASGTVGTTVVFNVATTNNFVTGINADGTVTKSQPTFANISSTITDAQVPNNITIDLAATATALATNPSNCSAGTIPRGVDASGVGEGCAAVDASTELTGNLGISRFNSGTGASATTAWFGDGTWKSVAGGGDFTGPGSSTTNDLVSFNDTTGKVGKDSGVLSTNVVQAASNFVSGGLVKASGANKNLQSADLSGDITTSGGVAATLANIPTGVPMAGSLLATATAAPGTPASGKGSIYVDSTSKNIAVKDDAGTIKHGIQDVSCSNQVISAVSAAGVGTCHTVVAADIAGSTITGSQIASSIALAGNPTTTTASSKDNSTKIATTAYVDAPTPLTAGTSVTLTAPRQYFVCTSTCTITVPVPAAGYEFCVMNDDNVATVITLSAIGSSARYENTARTAYGTAGTGTFVSSGAAGDKVCLLGRDSTHYLTASFTGSWTAN